MQDILASLRREDRRRKIAANAVLLCLIALVVILGLFAWPVDEKPRQLALYEPQLPWLHVNHAN
jgi:hypothetical protein